MTAASYKEGEVIHLHLIKEEGVNFVAISISRFGSLRECHRCAHKMAAAGGLPV